MNICFITQCSLPIPTTKGGAVETLVEYILAENEKQNKFHFTVLSIADESAKTQAEAYKNTEFVYINKKSEKINGLLLQAYRVLKHMNVFIPFSLEFYEALKILKTIQNQDFFIFEAGPTTQLPALSKIIPKEKLLVHIHWDGMGDKRKDQCFSHLIPVSDYIGREWQKASGCEQEKIMPLYNCAKIDRFTKRITQEEQNQLKEKLGIPKSNRVIIFTGRIVQEKGVKELLEAFEKVQHPDVSLVMIGSANFGARTNTPYEKEIASIIDKCEKQVVFTGFVHQTKLYQYYNIADIAVMPSLFQDPAPLVCIETQATGTALIATRVGGIPEYTTPDTAILVEKDENLSTSIANQIDYLLDNPDIIKSMGIAGEQHARNFSTTRYYAEFCELIHSISAKE